MATKAETKKHADRAHARLSASSSKRWLACPPSVQLEDQFPDPETSEYAKEGTLAHEIAELKLTKYFVEGMARATYTRRFNKFKKHELYQPEMDTHTDTYLEYLKGIYLNSPSKLYAAIEKRVDYGAYAPEGFGTVDCLMIGRDTLYITDLKYGKGIPVEAEDNSQMRLYALGAYEVYKLLYPITHVVMTIVQPRLDKISSVEMALTDLLAWGESIKPIAQQAFNGEGAYNPGEHCRFCKAKTVCRARSDSYTALEDFGGKKPPLLSNAEVGAVLKRGEHLDKWVKDLKEYALTASLKGETVDGWKAVEGRGSRDYVDIDKAFDHLKANGVEESVLYDRVPLTVPKIEKVLGKAQYTELLDEAEHVAHYPGKPALVSASDKRPAVTSLIDPREDFGQ